MNCDKELQKISKKIENDTFSFTWREDEIHIIADDDGIDYTELYHEILLIKQKMPSSIVLELLETFEPRRDGYSEWCCSIFDDYAVYDKIIHKFKKYPISYKILKDYSNIGKQLKKYIDAFGNSKYGQTGDNVALYPGMTVYLLDKRGNIKTATINGHYGKEFWSIEKQKPKTYMVVQAKLLYFNQKNIYSDKIRELKNKKVKLENKLKNIEKQLDHFNKVAHKVS